MKTPRFYITKLDDIKHYKVCERFWYVWLFYHKPTFRNYYGARAFMLSLVKRRRQNKLPKPKWREVK